MEIKDYIKKRRSELNLTMKQVAEFVGVSEATISRWESGQISEMRRDKAAKLAKILMISPAIIMGWNPVPGEEKPDYPTIPLVGRVAAGLPIYAETNIEGYVDVPSTWSKSGEYFALRVRGDSMEPLISDKDIIIVHEQNIAEAGEVVVATINGDDGVVKKLVRFGKNTALLSMNATYDPIDVTDREDFQIWGKVIEIRKRL